MWCSDLVGLRRFTTAWLKIARRILVYLAASIRIPFKQQSWWFGVISSMTFADRLIVSSSICVGSLIMMEALWSIGRNKTWPNMQTTKLLVPSQLVPDGRDKYRPNLAHKDLFVKCAILMTVFLVRMVRLDLDSYGLVEKPECSYAATTSGGRIKSGTRTNREDATNSPWINCTICSSRSWID